jgi:dihydrofolate reductase
METVMRKIINSTYITLDGVIDSPQNWPALEGPGDDGAVLQTDLLLACDAVLMGRRTYEGFAPVWPTRSGDPYSDRINVMRKYVVSTTLSEPEWENTLVIAGDLVEQVRALKTQPGQDIVQYGFGSVSFALMEHGLIDELRLWVHPFFLGSGTPEDLLFRPCPPAHFAVDDLVRLDNGIVVLTYRPR